MFTHISFLKIAAVVAAVVVVGGAGYMIVSKKSAPMNSVDSGMVTVDQKDTKTPSGKKMAFAEFVKQGGSYQCTVNQYVQDIESKGKVFISNERISGTFSTKVQGMTVDTNILVRDGYSYTWSSMMQGMGFKIKTVDPKATASNPDVSASGTYSFNTQQIGDYDCTPWSVNESVFTIPTNITFKTL